FAIGSGRETDVFGRRLILVDDVFTTGATVSAVARVLKRAGAADVTVLTFARALSDPI
ncbi:MAG TPA: phosphoribosyltransferase family protein, partial [Rhizobium sp.]|nr:phosphoribosyltransferase family protein [Rhizobium sp.]